MKDFTESMNDILFVDHENETFQRRLEALTDFITGLDIEEETRSALTQLTRGFCASVGFLSYMDGMLDGIEKQRKLN